jgi:hypothetical protein
METFLFFHSASSETWERIADFGSWMVVWGVLGEGLEISIKLAQLLRIKWNRIWNWLSLCSILRGLRSKCALCFEWCDRHELAIEVWGGFWWLVVVLGLVIELGANQRARRIDGAENVQLHKRAANLETNAAELKLEAEQLHSTNLLLRSNIVALEVRMQPRMIEISRPAARLNQFAGTKVVIISSVVGDCVRVANQVAEILGSAGWHVSGLRTFKAVPDGLTVGLSSSTEGLHLSDWWGVWRYPAPAWTNALACIALVDELNKGGIAAKLEKQMYSRTSLREDVAIIFIGPKPDPIESKIDEMESQRRILGLQIDGVNREMQPLLSSWTKRTIPPPLAALFAKRDSLENAEGSILQKILEMSPKRLAALIPQAPTNRLNLINQGQGAISVNAPGAGMFNLGYEILP